SLTTQNSLLSESFEAGLGTFVVDSGLWHASTSCASTLEGHSVPGTLYYGLDGSRNFDTGSAHQGTARSLPVSVDFASSPSLTFNYFIGGESGSTYDRASVQVSIDGGAPITVASTFGSGLALTKNSGLWQSAVVDLSSLTSGIANVELIFGFNTVASIANSGAGFYADDVELLVVDTSCDSDADCDDGVDCTIDLCDLTTNTCGTTPDDALCDNGVFCDGVETCGATGCVTATAPVCDDGVSCTVDFCDEDSDSCSSEADDSACDNGAFCDGVETCDAVLDCQPGVPVECDDGVDCTVDSCDEASDSCVA